MNSTVKQTCLSIVLTASLLFVLSVDTAAQKKKTSATPSKTAKSCAAQIEAILKDTIFNRTFVGIHVVSLKSGKTVFQQHANRLFRPASNLKLFTSAAALALLGKDFQLKTELYTDSIVSGVIRGSVYLKSYGNSLLTTSHLDSLARSVYGSGIRQIQGDIVGDVSYMDDAFWGRGWMWDDDPGYLWPYLTPLSLNGNAFTITVSPGATEGDSLSVQLDPPTRYIRIVNRGITSWDTAGKQLKITRRWKERQNVVTIDGALHPRASGTATRFNVWRPEFYTLEVFRERLLAAGVTVQGVVRVDTATSGRRLALISHPLDSLVTLVNKESYNLGAELLLKTLAAELRGTPGSADSGIVAVKQYLARTGIDTAAMIIADGSGVSRYNLVPPSAITKLLAVMYRDKKIFETFWKGLAIAGIDGTLKRRFVNSVARNNVRGKTGEHSDVVALSGYAVNTRNDTLAFAILFNHFPSNAESYRKAQDRIVEILVNCR